MAAQMQMLGPGSFAYLWTLSGTSSCLAQTAEWSAVCLFAALQPVDPSKSEEAMRGRCG